MSYGPNSRTNVPTIYHLHIYTAKIIDLTVGTFNFYSYTKYITVCQYDLHLKESGISIFFSFRFPTEFHST